MQLQGIASTSVLSTHEQRRWAHKEGKNEI